MHRCSGRWFDVNVLIRDRRLTTDGVVVIPVIRSMYRLINAIAAAVVVVVVSAFVFPLDNEFQLLFSAINQFFGFFQTHVLETDVIDLMNIGTQDEGKERERGKEVSVP